MRATRYTRSRLASRWTSTSMLLVAMLVVAGCGDGAKDNSKSNARSVTSTTAQARAPLPAKWYADSDGNGIPNFIEVEIGKDPRADDCTQRQCPLPAGATADQATRGRATVIALDASGSMASPAGGGTTKMAAAKQAIRSYVRNTPAALDRFGFVVFGNRGSSAGAGRSVSCKGVQTLAPVGGFSGDEVSGVLSRFRPRGWTPIAAALTEAGRSFRAGEQEIARILLVTDGRETCGGNPVAAATALQRKGVHVTVDIVGLDVNAGEAARLRSVADATGGRYTDAPTTSALTSRFQGFVSEQTRLTSQLICLSAHSSAATICHGSTANTATINMKMKSNALRIDGDDAGADEIDGLITVLRARAEDDVDADQAAVKGRIAKIEQQLDQIAKQTR